MNKLELKTYPDPCLRIKTNPVESIDQEIVGTLRLMSDLMYLHNGIGLAATQVGVGLSLVVVDLGDELINFINPEIVDTSKEKDKMEEGCLSLPDIT
ncbi:MAG: peptide deformylase, partial [Candidatus Omnitrophica bacterium]|nr:peptide deformylase [Candidatus Omnitrophota bacterium]